MPLGTVLKVEGSPFLDGPKPELWQPGPQMKKAAESQPRPVPKARPSLAESERQVRAESREGGRKRLQEPLQQLAREAGQVFPLAQRTPGPTDFTGVRP